MLKNLQRFNQRINKQLFLDYHVSWFSFMFIKTGLILVQESASHGHSSRDI